MKLSILIPTVKEREILFNKLYDFIYNQIKSSSLLLDIEIIYIQDNKEISIGAKRQLLLGKAKGEYIVFIDDDDWISEKYISEIWKALQSNPDCVGFKIDCSINGKNKKACASFRYKDWAENKDGFDYVRTIYHKTPVKRELALSVGFKDLRYGEDYEYCMRLQPFLKTEVFIDEALYFYRYSSKQPHKEKYGIRK